MTLADHQPLNYEPVSSLVLKTLLSTFSFVTAMNMKDVIAQMLNLIVPNNPTQQLTFNFFVMMLFLLATVLMAYEWQDYMSA